ncbi:tetratricopeptide repeat protein (macronuclear) [Tetrahymena thermophila SB210]|uniref:Tetratricopeptide repeat protein n=1 Tax=Tetrahymena thermophila (strain SB210) TaxID=312017 RepID=I7MFS1_TETTS|nr:tetratricopeptide repeat protein [Tetrahymena thermophila SB210]EAS00538.2 tetratricopeptide repeat protein [Tetrahymena thermophila SB210]|eukprot:XP_001020783.2 tetratricopeptide repeat protein [Tetrahymena thermophila SB210]
MLIFIYQLMKFNNFCYLKRLTHNIFIIIKQYQISKILINYQIYQLFHQMEDKKKLNTNKLKIPAYNLQNDIKCYNDTLKFKGPQGHGYAAERLNNLVDQFKGKKAVVLNDNVKNGPDRISNGVYIQTKYCNNAQATFKSCFQDGKFRYSGQQIEVPPEQYDQVVKLFQDRGIKDVTIRKGHVSYKVAKNIAKSGTIEGLTYDTVTGIKMGVNTFGISFLLTFACTKWSGGSTEECVQESLLTALQSSGMTAVSHILSQQFIRSSFNRFNNQKTLNRLKKLLSKDQLTSLVNKFKKQGVKKIYAQQNVAKMANIQIINTVSILVVQTFWDVIEVTRGKISKEQLLKNFICNLSSAGGSLCGTLYGTCLGGPVGGLIGGIAGGQVAQYAIKKILDKITPDLDKMVEILQSQICKLQQEKYLPTQQEYKEILNNIEQHLKNFFCNLVSAGGVFACSVYVICTGPVGSLVGTIVRGQVTQYIVKKILDKITPDLDKMVEIFQSQICQLQQEEYLLTQQEYEEILNKISLEIKEDFFKSMFESSDRQLYAKKKVKPYFQQALKNRPKIQVNEEINKYLKFKL